VTRLRSHPRRRKADGQAGRRQLHRLPQNLSVHREWCGAECDANADLARPLAHRVRDDGIKTERSHGISQIAHQRLDEEQEVSHRLAVSD
jgi:hypothetical protein